MSHEPVIRPFFDESTSTVTYLVSDPATGKAAVIDSVLDYDPRAGKVLVHTADAVLAAAAADGLDIEWILETHAHADHLSAASYLRSRTGAKVGTGEHIREVQAMFVPMFNLDDVSGDGSEFDGLFRDGELVRIGELDIEVMYTPGHTPACVSYRAGDDVFVGDTLFMPDYGTARTDFPGGSAKMLYHSIQRLLQLPDDTRLYMCHDYKAPGREHFAWQTTVKEERDHNVHMHRGMSEAEFIAMRGQRDATLATPVLLLPAIQANIRAGNLPRAESNGVRYFKIPLTLDAELTRSGMP
ncbi:MAG TPA: MBL fold metallo-hydrolase [Povalibacter sp.]|nr:MBL fold metallo-hydrolase [Povalibacter sp.]